MLRLAVVGIVVGLAGLCVPQAARCATTPNVLLIMADDCTYRDLQIHGGQARTPHLVRLAAEGMQFSHCFQAAPMCSPTRHCLYTGLYPVKSGAHPNHTEAYDWVKSIAHSLQPAGYRTFLSGKRHIGPASVFPFEYSGKGNNPDPQAIDRALGECAASDTPFLIIAASNEPHGPHDKGDASAYPPGEIELPPVLVDTPETRDQFSRYLAEITYFDSQVGELLSLLEKHGRRNDTIVIVLSEQGNGFPFAKWTCYDAGLQSACIVRWPGVVAAGSRSDALIEYVDVVPTLLDALGLEQPEILDGRSFLPVLKGDSPSHKDYVYALQTTRGIINGSDSYGIRSVRSDRYRYIRNLTPDAVFTNAATRSETFKSWRRLAAKGDNRAQKLVHDYQHRPAEELYDCQADPWNRTNLIDNEKLAGVRDELRNRLDAWMKAQGDKGQATEMAAFERMPRRKKPK